MNVTSVFKGITTPLNDILSQIETLGWQISKLDWGKESYVAQASNEYGEKIERTGVTDATAAANVLLAIIRRHAIRTSAQHYGGMWQTSWADRLSEIANAYATAPVYDPKAAPAWKELAKDSQSRLKILGEQLAIEPVNHPEPYAHAHEMHKDIHNRKYKISTHNLEHPVWSADEHMAFRAVHDIMGHAVAGSDWGWHGQNLAAAAHLPLLGPEAQKALFTEAVAGPAYAYYYRSFGPKKIAFLNDFMERAQKEENPPGHSGVHPSFSVAPLLPAHQPEPGKISSKISVTLRDPNYGYQTPFAPDPGMSAQMDMGLPHPETGEWVDPLDAHGVIENARKNHREWWDLKKEDGSPDRERMKQVIVNALRAVILSPKKKLRWNAIHYQDLATVPYTETDPKVYWDTLERHRQAWNVRHFGEQYRLLHREFVKSMPHFVAALRNQYPSDTVPALWERAHEMIFDWEMNIESDIEMREREKAQSKNKELDPNIVYKEVVKQVAKMIENYVQTPGAIPGADFTDEETPKPLPKAQKIKMPPTGKNLPPSEEHGGTESRYQAFMGTHLQPMARFAEYADELLDAALEDIREHDSSGWHFRQQALSLNIKGLGPKVISFAWLLLCPMKSQLGTMDTHMVDTLGAKEEDLNDRDYFKYERMLQATRDKLGYHNVPLGLYQWAVWDYKRTGPGTHQDHSPLAPHEPTPHDSIEWHSTMDENMSSADVAEMKSGWATNAPWWWKQTEEARQQVHDEFAQQFTGSKNKIPFKVEATLKGARKIAARGQRPWFMINENLHMGEPRESYAQLIRRTLNQPVHEMWHREDIALGRYDPDSDIIDTVAGTPSLELHEMVRQSIMRGNSELTRQA